MKNKKQIMVYGAESQGYETPTGFIERDNFVIKFCPLDTERDFAEFDIVMFFDSTFENSHNGQISCANKPELQKRAKQVFNLLNKKGLVCGLVYAIKDSWRNDYYGYHKQDSYDTSLLKVVLNDIGINKQYRSFTNEPRRHFKVHRSEYVQYMNQYGVTETLFRIPYYLSSSRPITSIDLQTLTGFIYNDRVVVLPCHAPDKKEKDTIALFEMLSRSILETLNKLSVELPDWVVDQVTLPQESEIKNELVQLSEKVKELDAALDNYYKLKSILCLSGEVLVERVSFVFENFIQMRTSIVDEYKDDLRLLRENSEGELVPVCIAEVKGVNSGVKREYINQADSHRERLGLPQDFPTLLIVNTRMDVNDLETKDQEVAKEQVLKAVSDKVLVLRTLDLFNIVYLIETDKITRDRIVEIFISEHGWLKVSKDGYEIIRGHK